jgi:uncharacterized protein YdhG (YjbR/CyaY superfamily)
MTSKSLTADAFLAGLPADRRDIVSSLVAAVRKAAPKAAESMQYGMPSWHVDGQFLCGLNAQKNYFSFYVDEATHREHAHLLKELDCGKSCIRFRKADLFPPALATRLVRTRLAQLKADG